jgi:hypothetical protein
MEPSKNMHSFLNLFLHALEDLFPWAVYQVYLPKVSNWKSTNTKRMEEKISHMDCQHHDPQLAHHRAVAERVVGYLKE